HPLPKPSVDTGMGLERISAVLQGVHANYEIDLFQALIKAAARETNCADLESPSLKVLADHIRACSFLIADGVIPGNEGRGYVLRRIIRRAIRHGYKLGARDAFFYKMVPDLVEQMGTAYPELVAEQVRVKGVLKLEEERFFTTLESGMEILGLALDFEQVKQLEPNLKLEGLVTRSSNLKFHSFLDKNNVSQKAVVVLDHAPTEEISLNFAKAIDSYKSVEVVERNWSGLTLPGHVAFKLHDTYGFPLDLTADVCREHNVKVDEAGFNVEMARQKEQARATGKFKMAANLEYSGPATTFHGYQTLEHKGNVLALYKDGVEVNELVEGELGVVVLDDTPFYAESGGQVGDSGELRSVHGIFAVEDTQKIQAAVFGHHGVVKTGKLSVGNGVNARVDMLARARTERNHSVTHLMHKALREVLGAHVQQKGSQVDPDKTRFDFVQNQPLTDAEIRKVEALVNAEILANSATDASVMGIEDAQKTGAMMLFGEKYGDEVRVLSIGSSKELCGGTHVKRTGDIGLFKIVAESGVAAGVRRVEAVTGEGALALVQQQEEQLQQVADAVKAQPQEAAARIAQILDNVKSLEKELAALKSKLASAQGDELLEQAQDFNGVKVLAAKLDGADTTTLRETMDKLKDKLKSAVIVLATEGDGKVSLIAGVTADATSKVKAGELVNFVAQQVGGKGGGRPDMAQAGGTQPEHLAKALASVADWAKAKL
ncbi:MAG: alanine--tRNA ligase, partial [Sideroxydans sp.]|nr:alanine--tRNA ligase [Sideroxydans sp.]